jgi:cell shape-determining protein MreC
MVNVLQKLEEEMAELKLRIKELELIEKENAALRELVHHLASRPAPYIQPPI